MTASTPFVGLNVHEESIDAAVAVPGRGGEIPSVNPEEFTRAIDGTKPYQPALVSTFSINSLFASE